MLIDDGPPGPGVGDLPPSNRRMQTRKLNCWLCVFHHL